MNVNDFIVKFRTAFGDYELPVAFWYSDAPAGNVNKTKGCFIKDLKPARQGNIVSLNEEAISCHGGKTYTGFAPAPPFIPDFVSIKEKYKQAPDDVRKFISDLDMSDKSCFYLNFVTIDNIESFDNIEGLIFFATPDVLSGLVAWTVYDSSAPDAVSVPFASGCSATIAQTVVENRNNGSRTFLGMFDPSVRPHVEENILSLAIPISRFKVMYHTFAQSCLSGTHAWGKVKHRICKEE